MGYILSNYMSLPIPGVGTEQGPDYAIDVNQCLTLIDQHNHSPGSGAPITPASLLINNDLDIATNSLLNIKSLQLAPLSAFATALSLYIKPGSEVVPINDLWFNDGNGTPIQITENGLVKATLASLPGQSYSAGIFIWKQGSGSTTPADFDIGSITLRPNIAATTYGTTIRPHASIATSFTLTLPNNPSGLTGNSFLTMDASGNITAGPTVNAGLTTSNLSATAGILGSQIASTTITDSNMVAKTITAASIADHTITSLQLASTGVVAGSYPGASVTVNAEGQVTSISSGGTLVSGTYTPTISNISNTTGIVSAVAQYMQVGSVVTVSGGCEVQNQNGVNSIVFSISLPSLGGSNFTVSSQLGGAVNGVDASGVQVLAGTAVAAVGQHIARCTISLTTTNPIAASFTFTYLLV